MDLIASPHRQKLAMLAACFLCSWLFIFIYAGSPMVLLPDAIGDDGLFMKLGRSLAGGHWLGDFNAGTLMKGAGYPIFLAISHYTMLPVSITHALLFIVALAAFCYGIARVFGSPLLGTVVYCATVLHPSFLVERVLRDSIYAAQTFLIIGGLLVTLFVWRGRRALAAGVATGAALAWFWVTREEGIWIAPLAILIAFAAMREFRSARTVRTTGRQAGAVLAGFLAGITLVHGGNWAAYGKFQGVDVKEANFAGALAVLQSVRDGDQIDYVPISKSTRQLVYAVSPTFASMKPYIDPPDGKVADYGCQYYAWTCGDIAGGWFIWIFKGSSAYLGAYASPMAATAFFGKIRTEVEQACDDGRLHCEAGIVSYVPKISGKQVASIWPTTLQAVDFFFQTSWWWWQAASSGTPQQQADALAFLNYPAITSATPSPTPAQKVAAALRNGLAAIYRPVLLVLLPLGALAGIVAAVLAIRTRLGLTDLAIAGTLWLLVLSRLGLIVLVHISAFPAIGKSYLSPALYLSVPAAILSLAALAVQIRLLRYGTAGIPASPGIMTGIGGLARSWRGRKRVPG